MLNMLARSVAIGIFAAGAILGASGIASADDQDEGFVPGPVEHDPFHNGEGGFGAQDSDDELPPPTVNPPSNPDPRIADFGKVEQIPAPIQPHTSSPAIRDDLLDKFRQAEPVLLPPFLVPPSPVPPLD